MRYSYRLDGLGCAHCASVIEREVQGWQDVKSANLDLMTNKLVIESDTDAQVMTERVKECVYRVESKVKVVPLAGAVAPKPVATPAPVHNGACDCGHDHHDHAHTHDGACDCGHDHHDHAHTHDGACDCGHDHHDHAHTHDGACGCAHDHHDHAHTHDGACDCGHDHHDHAHAHDGACDCGHDHHDHAHTHDGACDCGHDHHNHTHDGACDCGHDHHDHKQNHAAAASGKAAPIVGGQQYVLDGLSCAHCASVIEHEIQSWSDIKAANLDLMKNVLTIDTDVAPDVMFERVREAVAKVESGVRVSPKQADAPTKTNEKVGWFAMLMESARGESLRFVGALATLVVALFLPEGPVATACFILSYLIVGLPVLRQALRGAMGGFVFNEQMLMGVASLGAMLVGEFAEGVAVMLFYTLGEMLQEVAVNRSKRSIASLLDLRPDTVRLQTANGWEAVAPEAVAIGSLIQVQPGERIALDGTVVNGSAQLDTSAITGESRPFDVAEGDSVQSGAVNTDGVLIIRVEKVYSDSTLARILSLVEDASARKAPAEKFISRFARYYTPVVVGLALLVGVVPPLLGMGDWQTWIYRGLVFLVVSCPCALVISVPLTYFAGIGGASRQHILVKGSQYLESLAQVKQVAFDKTGTLTEGAFHVAEVQPKADLSKEDILKLAASLEQYAAHPLAEAIVKAAPGTPTAVDDYHNIAGQGIRAEMGGKTYYIGNPRLMEANGIAVDDKHLPVGTTVLLADEKRLLGIIILEDTPKEGVREAMDELRRLGVTKTAILSGDRTEVVQQLANRLHMSDVHGELLPADKIDCVETMMNTGDGTLAFVGDGINDAPVLARADVGIAMGGVGSDAAIEAADVVLMSDHPRDVVKAIKVARKTRRISLQNVIGALAFKALLLVLATVGMANMWMAVFADVGVAIICVINAMRAMGNVK